MRSGDDTAGRPEAASPESLAGSAPSLERLGRDVLDALMAGDVAALERLRLSEREHNDIIWPELPASRPGVDYPVDLAWANIERRNRRELDRALKRLAPAELTYRDVKCRGQTQRFDTFRVLTDCWVAFEDPRGRSWEAQLFKDVLVRRGGHKIFRYYGDPPLPRASSAGSTKGQRASP